MNRITLKINFEPFKISQYDVVKFKFYSLYICIISMHLSDIFNSAYLNRLLNLARFLLWILVNSRFCFVTIVIQIRHLNSYEHSVKSLLLQLLQIAAFFIITSSSVNSAFADKFSSFFESINYRVPSSHSPTDWIFDSFFVEHNFISRFHRFRPFCFECDFTIMNYNIFVLKFFVKLFVYVFHLLQNKNLKLVF